MSANVTDSRGLFLVKRARHEGPTYTAVLLKDVTVSQLLHYLRGAPVRLDTVRGYAVIRPTESIPTPPDAA